MVPLVVERTQTHPFPDPTQHPTDLLGSAGVRSGSSRVLSHDILAMRVSVSTIALFALNTIVTALVTSMLMHGQDNSPGGVARGGHPHELNRRSDCPAVVCPRCPAGGEAAAPAAAKCPVCSCAAAGRAGAAVAGGAADSGILRSGIVLDTQRGNVVCGVPVLKTDPATGLLRMPPGVKRVWVDVGTHARAQNTRPELDKPSGKDLMIIGFEPNRFQWGEISTINFSPVVNGHQTGWGYGHERFFAFPAAASNESGYATFHRGNENMCSSLKVRGLGPMPGNARCHPPPSMVACPRNDHGT